MTSLSVPAAAMNRPWQMCMRPSKRELVIDDHVDPVIEKHMTLPTRVSLVPRPDSFQIHKLRDGTIDSDEEEQDDEDSDDSDDDSTQDDDPELSKHRPVMQLRNGRSGSLTVRLRRFPNPEEAKETESFDGRNSESIASQQQREVFDNDYNVISAMSLAPARSIDSIGLKASESIVQQQMAILRQIQEENHNVSVEATTCAASASVSSGTYKRPRGTRHAPLFDEPLPQRRVPSPQARRFYPRLSESASASSADVVLSPPPLEPNATANLAMFLQGRKVQMISQARVEAADRKGLAIKVVCVGCEDDLMAARDMAMVYCPSCGTLAPLNLAVMATKSRH